MQNTPTPRTLDTAPTVPTVADATADLAVALEQLQVSDRAIATAVTALSRVIGTGVAQTVEGLPLDLVLAKPLPAGPVGPLHRRDRRGRAAVDAGHRRALAEG